MPMNGNKLIEFVINKKNFPKSKSIKYFVSKPTDLSYHDLDKNESVRQFKLELKN